VAHIEGRTKDAHRPRRLSRRLNNQARQAGFWRDPQAVPDVHRARTPSPLPIRQLSSCGASRPSGGRPSSRGRPPPGFHRSTRDASRRARQEIAALRRVRHPRSRSTRPPASTGRRRGGGGSWRGSLRRAHARLPSAADLASHPAGTARTKSEAREAQAPRGGRRIGNGGMRPLLPRRRSKQVTRLTNRPPDETPRSRRSERTRRRRHGPRKKEEATPRGALERKPGTLETQLLPRRRPETGDEARLEPPC